MGVLMQKQKTIGVTPAEYKQLKRAKVEYEKRMGRKFDWGSFLLGLGLGFLGACTLADSFRDRPKKRSNRKTQIG